MNDLADRADSECEHELAEALRLRRRAGPPAMGMCHYCMAVVAPGARWCDKECRDAWEAEERALGVEWGPQE